MLTNRHCHSSQFKRRLATIASDSTVIIDVYYITYCNINFKNIDCLCVRGQTRMPSFSSSCEVMVQHTDTRALHWQSLMLTEEEANQVNSGPDEPDQSESHDGPQQEEHVAANFG